MTRRPRNLVIAAVVFALVVLATGMPVSALLSQRHQLSSSASELSRLRTENTSLRDEARQLNNPASVGALARTNYGLVPNGDKAYDILPASGSSATAGTSSGHVPLNGPPVVPGSSQSEALLGLSAGNPTSSSTLSGSSNATHTPAVPGLWGRVRNTLEFWR